MRPAPPDQRGFTLLELMVVLMIIGIIIGMATLSAGGDGRRGLLKEEAQRLKALIDLAAREAILNQRELGLRLTPRGYAFQMFDEEKGWLPPPDDALLKQRRLPEPIRVTLLVEGLTAETDPLPSSPPQLIFFSSGEIIPFDMALHGVDEHLYRLTGEMGGDLTLAYEAEP